MRSLIVAAAVSSACGGGGDSDVVVDLGVIADYQTGEASIEHPMVVRVGADVSITVNTTGCDECTQPVRTEVSVNGLETSIWPYDRTYLGLCGDCLSNFPHAVTVEFEQPGTAVIRVFGYRAGDRFGTMIERTSSLTVEE
jgi:hypothetical protein